MIGNDNMSNVICDFAKPSENRFFKPFLFVRFWVGAYYLYHGQTNFLAKLKYIFSKLKMMQTERARIVSQDSLASVRASRVEPSECRRELTDVT